MMKRKPIEGTPTMIRHFAVPEEYKGHDCQLVGIVTSVSTAEAFTAHFHVHRVFPNGLGQLLSSGGQWTHEQGATAQWDEWKAARRLPDEVDNNYICPCGNKWGMTWSCACNDKCGECGREIEPEVNP